jgi:hypothetical protein
MGRDVGCRDRPPTIDGHAAQTLSAANHGFVGDKATRETLVGVQQQLPGLLVDEKDLTCVGANHSQCGLESAPQYLIQILGAIDLGGDGGEGRQLLGPSSIRQSLFLSIQ